MSAHCWIILATLVLGCNSSPEQPDRAPRPAPPSRSNTPAVSAPAAPPAVTSESFEAGAPASGELTGNWEGRYDAKKGSVTLPPKVKDKSLDADDGKVAVGPGSIELVIAAKGDIRGKMSGALGAGTISGKVDGSVIRAVVRPDDPSAAHAMTGIFVGERKGETLACELHVAGPDGTLIRESTVELTRKR
jgi:hypothetical protein